MAIEWKQKIAYEKIQQKLSNTKKLTIDKYFGLKAEMLTPVSIELKRSFNSNNPDYLDRIKWINWRTMCSLDMPCSICGKWKEQSCQMHHVKIELK